MSKVTNPDPTPAASIPSPLLDLASLDLAKKSDEGAEIELTHPISGEGLGIFWGVLGKHSQVFRETMKERVNNRMRRDALARRRGKDIEPSTAEQAEAEAVELLVLCSTGWRTETYKLEDNKKVVDTNEPTIPFEGANLSFTVANAKMILERMLWVREQVDSGVGDLENFMKH